jgi:hypothetical protein
MFSEEDGVNDVRRLGVVKALHGVCRCTIKRQVMGDGRCNTILIVLSLCKVVPDDDETSFSPIETSM